MNADERQEPEECRWPAEWEPQSATWIAWPHNRDTWPGHFENIPAAFAAFIAELSRVQPVHVLSGPAGIQPDAVERLSDLANVAVHSVPTNDSWIRDFGPTFVYGKSDGRLAGIDWKYNAWGGKYPPFDDDAAAAIRICKIVGCRTITSPMHCEGGALEGDGCGTLLTTSSCLLTETRNPDWSRARVERELARCLGVIKVIWVDGGGLIGDDTDGHIDQIARFVAPGKVVAAVSGEPADPNSDGLRANLDILRRQTDAAGNRLIVSAVPTPAPRFVDGKRVPESYCNFLIANEIVIVPTFRSPETDRFAVELLGQLIPDRRVIPLDAYDLIVGLGAFHCLSQQQPR